MIYVTRSVKINHVRAQKSARFSTLCCRNLHFSFANKVKIAPHMQHFVENLLKLTARMKLSPLEQKILMNIQLGVICTDMVDFCRRGHIS